MTKRFPVWQRRSRHSCTGTAFDQKSLDFDIVPDSMWRRKRTTVAGLGKKDVFANDNVERSSLSSLSDEGDRIVEGSRHWTAAAAGRCRRHPEEKSICPFQPPSASASASDRERTSGLQRCIRYPSAAACDGLRGRVANGRHSSWWGAQEAPQLTYLTPRGDIGLHTRRFRRVAPRSSLAASPPRLHFVMYLRLRCWVILGDGLGEDRR